MAIRFPRFPHAAGGVLTLSPGEHNTAEEGLCAMEAAAWLAGLPHSDRPRCTTEIIAAYVRHCPTSAPLGQIEVIA